MLKTLIAVSLLAQAHTPHTQEIAPGVYAAGFAHRYGSANCGWVVLQDSVLLIDLPRGVEIPPFLEHVRKIAGKPVRGVLVTRADKGDEPILAALAKAGVPRLQTADDNVRYISYESREGGAVYLPRQKVLFAGPAVVNGPHAKLAGVETTGWISALRSLEKLSATVVVPGSGSWGGPEIVTLQRRRLEEVRRQVAYGVSMGRPLAAIAGELHLPASYYTWMPYDTPTLEDVKHVYAELTVPAAPYFGRQPERSASRPHALVLMGDRFHEPEHIENGLAPVFESTGVIPHYTVDVRALTAVNLARVNLLVILRDGMLWPDGPRQPHQIWMTPEQEKAVVDFVEAGGGFLNLHNSMGLYPEDGPYLKLVAGRYIGHGPLERFRVEVVDKDHPITRGVADYFAADEQHTPPYDEAKAHLLLRNRSDDGKAAAAGWVYEPGRGRLCHLASGHTREALEHPMYQRLLRNAVNWCLRR